MVSAKGSRIGHNGTYKVRDPFKLLLTLLLLIGLGLCAWVGDMHYLNYQNEHPNDWLMTTEPGARETGAWIIGVNLAAIATLFRLKALKTCIAVSRGVTEAVFGFATIYPIT